MAPSGCTRLERMALHLSGLRKPHLAARASLRAVALVTMSAVLAACRPGTEAAPAVEIEVSHVVAAEPLQLREGSYRNAAAETYRVTRLRYYLSGFRVQDAAGRWFEAPTRAESPEGYYLVDEAAPESKRFRLPALPAGSYTAIGFTLGVDAARNHAGAQTGALDPVRGMFWTWNSGYVFLKLEGQSPASPAPDHAYEYHLGSDALARRIVLPLGAKPLRIEPKLQPTVHLVADLSALFAGQPPLSIAATWDVMDAQKGAPIVDAAATMFRVYHIHHEPARAP